MSFNDPIADMLTRIRNGLHRGFETVVMPSSKFKIAIAQVLQDEGYIDGYSVEEGIKAVLTIRLRYYQGQPVISEIKRYSRPGLRQYRGPKALPRVRGGLGIAVVSTPKGVMTDRAARKAGVGGEVVCLVA